jgi:ATP-binding cassette subfamily B protein
VARILPLEAGRIDEIGTPAALAASGGIYAQLLDLQSTGDRRRLARFDITG